MTFTAVVLTSAATYGVLRLAELAVRYALRPTRPVDEEEGL